ncbi:hypothetical protein SUGI_0003150 [Cryptomeria japonica]|nr:hypothetical protein SUGI_0003150 [Cryptomeria japonica]
MSKADLMRNAKINVINRTSSKDYRLLESEEWKRSCCLDCCAEEVPSVRRKRFLFPWGKMSVKDLRHAVDSALAEIFGPDIVLAFHTFPLPKTAENALGVPKNGSSQIWDARN